MTVAAIVAPDLGMIGAMLVLVGMLGFAIIVVRETARGHMRPRLATVTLCAAFVLGYVLPANVATVRSATLAECGFLPTKTTESAILESFITGPARRYAVEPLNRLVISVASQVCATVKPTEEE